MELGKPLACVEDGCVRGWDLREISTDQHGTFFIHLYIFILLILTTTTCKKYILFIIF